MRLVPFPLFLLLCGVALGAFADERAAAGAYIEPAPAGTAPTVVFEGAVAEGVEACLLTWDMAVEGEKSWRFRAAFAGVHIAFLDDSDVPLVVQKHHTHCYRTVSKQFSWLLLPIPAETRRLQVAFAIESGEPLPGRFWVGHFALAPYPPAPMAAGEGRLTLSALSPDGASTPARFYIRNAEGDFIAPPVSFAYDGGRMGFHVASPDLNRFNMPAGRYTVGAMKGFEYEPVAQTVTIVEGQVADVRLPLSNRVNLEARGWYPGDHHTHLFRHGSTVYPMMNAGNVYDIAQGEGLAFVPFMGADRIESNARLTESDGFLGWATEELTRDLWGHICPIGAFEFPELEQHGELWPMNVDWMTAAAEAGGAIAYAHPYARLNDDDLEAVLSDPHAGHAARELPIAAALGHRFTIDMLTKEGLGGDFGLKLRDYFQLLNLGFQLGVSGSTDFHADQGRDPIGAMRTYVRADPFSWPTIAAGYREGRTFATNGPLLLLTVNDVQPGDTLNLPGVESVTCAVEAFSHWGINAVTLWHNGEAVQRWTSAGDKAILREHVLSMRTSGWVLLTATGPAAEELVHDPEGASMVEGQFAITSPVYIYVPGHPAGQDTAAAGYFLDWVRTARAGFEAACDVAEADGSPLPDPLYEKARARFDEAEAVYADLAR